jgi:hypothetical protein
MGWFSFIEKKYLAKIYVLIFAYIAMQIFSIKLYFNLY